MDSTMKLVYHHHVFYWIVCSCARKVSAHVLGVLILLLSNILIFDFGNVPSVWKCSVSMELFRQYGFWNCSVSMAFGTVPLVWLMELFRQYGFWKCSVSMAFGNVPSVWLLEMFRQYGFWNCSVNMAFGTVPSVWLLELFRQYGFWNCSVSMASLFFIWLKWKWAIRCKVLLSSVYNRIYSY